MINHNQNGSINALLLPLILAVVFLFGSLGFGAWAFSSRQDYKTNVDKKINAAVVIAKQQESAEKDQQYAEAAKQPLKTYNGPDELGSLVLQYPKTWSAYVDTTSSGDAALDGYFNPDTVPSVEDPNSAFALRVKVLDQAYDDVLKQYDGNEGVTVAPFSLSMLPEIIGVRIEGQLEDQKQGSMIMVPIRDKTLQIYTQSQASLADFNDIILPNVTFSP